MSGEGDDKKDPLVLPPLVKSPEQFLQSAERQQAATNIEEDLFLKADALMEDPANEPLDADAPNEEAENNAPPETK